MAAPDVNQIDKIDEIGSKIGTLQLEILGILTLSGQEHQAVDAKHAPELNPLYRELQGAFDELRSVAKAHQDKLLKGDKKSSQRTTCLVGWRSEPRLVLHVTEKELIDRLKEAGQSVYRRFVRKTVKYEINRTAILSKANRQLVENLAVDGFEINLDDDFYVVPSGGVRMSSSENIWPGLEGKAGPSALKTMLSDQDA